jgi:hypothetical protein
MQRTWRVRRTAQPRADGQQRWDRAYQLLIRGPCVDPTRGDPRSMSAAPNTEEQEAAYEDRNLCSRLVQVAGPGSVH